MTSLVIANPRLQIFLAILLLSCVLFAPCSGGGLLVTTGKEWHQWTEGGYSVIAARVREVRQAPGDAGEAGSYFAVLEPLAVFAGSLDPSEHATIRVSMYVGQGGTSIESPPKQGSMVLAVVQWGNFIVSDICTFMPDQSALAEVTGLGDPRVIETLKKIQDARAHAEPDPHLPRPPATRPASATKPKS